MLGLVAASCPIFRHQLRTLTTSHISTANSVDFHAGWLYLKLSRNDPRRNGIKFAVEVHNWLLNSVVVTGGLKVDELDRRRGHLQVLQIEILERVWLV